MQRQTATQRSRSVTRTSRRRRWPSRRWWTSGDRTTTTDTRLTLMRWEEFLALVIFTGAFEGFCGSFPFFSCIQILIILRIPTAYVLNMWNIKENIRSSVSFCFDHRIYITLFCLHIQWTRQFRVIDSSGSPSHIHFCFFRMPKYTDLLIIQSFS